ncbi:MAG: hypothetical protein GVY29_11805 [Spirochaetes bacterium]|jgi:hypothetical protein|nr:hypothetical protein [Spirochaetota bacterium]
MSVQYVVDEKGNKTGVFLPYEEYQSLLERLEELGDARDVEAAQAEPDLVSWEEAKRELGVSD